MSAATITFDDVREKTGFTAGLTQAARNTKNAVLVPILAFSVQRSLTILVATMKACDWDSFSAQQRSEAKKLFQSLHSSLIKLLSLKGNFTFRNTIEERAEDIRDVIEMLILSENPDFKSLVLECASAVGLD
jgi:hypothetical protein